MTKVIKFDRLACRHPRTIMMTTGAIMRAVMRTENRPTRLTPRMFSHVQVQMIARQRIQRSQWEGWRTNSVPTNEATSGGYSAASRTQVVQSMKEIWKDQNGPSPARNHW